MFKPPLTTMSGTSKGMGLHVLMLILFQGQQDQSNDLYVHIVRCHLTQRLSELRPACTT